MKVLDMYLMPIGQKNDGDNIFMSEIEFWIGVDLDGTPGRVSWMDRDPSYRETDHVDG